MQRDGPVDGEEAEQGNDDSVKPRGESLASNVRKVSSTLQFELLGKKLITYYSEWCETPREAKPGVCFKDLCMSLGSEGAPVFIEKKPENNIYIYVPHHLKDPVLANATNRLNLFLAQTFWKNAFALDCQLAAIFLVLHGQHVDRCFWTIGPGGVGQSLVTHLLHNVFRGIHGFLDSNVFYSDDELRKQAESLIGKLILTAQEAVEGSHHGFREDLFKKSDLW